MNLLKNCCYLLTSFDNFIDIVMYFKIVKIELNFGKFELFGKEFRKTLPSLKSLGQNVGGLLNYKRAFQKFYLDFTESVGK